MFIICFSLISLWACYNENIKEEKHVEVLPPEGVTIIMQPFDDLSPILVDSIYKRLININPSITVLEPIPLPVSAYYSLRNRYRADSLINFLWQRSTTKSVVIGLTSKDISTKKGNIKDWGVIGLAYCPGHSCVVSTYRLSKNNIESQFFKIVIHELGHTQGLPHCQKSSTCLMNDYEGGNKTDELQDFCQFCKAHLERKGLEFKITDHSSLQQSHPSCFSNTR
ncbi:matrixin family metalloprotease [Dysgonomonas sp. ZJ279]|uniref:matrixin family metalloprotease n=1 Tax=Dysgonomonas sp. ZJ279 TaxID=2709796 RepID=UPI0013ED9C60|nr:matrixin family metalloprotease [Dysgonomonas sp. ZJ279]